MKFLKSLAPSKSSGKPVDYSWSTFGRRRQTNRDDDSLPREDNQPKTNLKRQKRRITLKHKKIGTSTTIPRNETLGDHSNCSDNCTESTVSTSASGETPNFKEFDQEDPYDELLPSSSVESHFRSFHGGHDSQMEDDRDESQVSSEIASRQFLESSGGRGERDGSEESVPWDRPPRPSLSDNQDRDSTLAQLPSVTRLRPKASTFRDIRRSQSEDSKNYVHVFHSQLHTLAEEGNCEDEISAGVAYDSDGDDLSIGAVHTQHFFSEFQDDEKLRQRWNYSKELMSNMEHD
jgi:hypothetical protein